MNIETTLKNSFSIWPSLPVDEKRAITQACEVKIFHKNDIIHRGHFDCTGLIIISEGCLRAYITSPQGKEVTLYHLYQYDICLFSASCLLKDINFDVEIACEEETIAVLIPTSRYERLVSDLPILSQYTSTILSEKFSNVMWLLEQIIFHSFDRRLANYLIDQSYQREDETLPFTHEKIAKDLGTAREVVSRMLKHFEEESMVKLERNKIMITNLSALSRLSENN
ncbi:MAG: Crp/Fnr family transcriptional regulator [Bacilli bacterium]|nr:Crp/Fnr family transcriptional regulator [Bacilli bacterium]